MNKADLPFLTLPAGEFIRIVAEKAATDLSSIIGPEDSVTLIWDTRSLPAVQEALRQRADHFFVFFATQGRSFDPLPEILAQKELLGSQNFCVFADPSHWERAKAAKSYGNLQERGFRVYHVAEPREILRMLCQSAVNRLSQNLNWTAGITGTNGKTSACHLYREGLCKIAARQTASIGTLGTFDGLEWKKNAFPTTPDLPNFGQALKGIQAAGTTMLVMEVSSHALSEARLGSFSFDQAIFTNLSIDHLDFHGSMEAYSDAKSRLFAHHLKTDGTAVICLRSASSGKMIEAVPNSARLICVEPRTHVPLSPHDPQFKAATVEVSKDGLNIHYVLVDRGEAQNRSLVLRNHFATFQVENALCVVAALWGAGYALDEVENAMADASAIPGRMEHVRPPSSAPAPLVFVDYAHTPEALEQALISLHSIKNEAKGDLYVIFGCGGDRDRSKRPLMGEVAATHADHIVLTSDNPRSESLQQIAQDILRGIPNEFPVHVQLDRGQAIRETLQKATSGDVVLIAGKGHETYQIIGPDVLDFSDQETAQKMLEELVDRDRI